MAKPTKISFAEPPSKDDLLALLDELRAEVETGECLSLVAVPIFSQRRFHVRSAGELSMLQLAGLLGRAWLDAQDALKETDE